MLPDPPAGSIAGGPNCGIQDPLAQRKLAGCAPQFVISMIAIHWNADLSWVASFVADLDNGANDGN